MNNYTTQWSDGKTCPVHVTGDMDHYLMSQALHMGLGDFNRKNLIAATFVKHNDKGMPPESGCLFLSVCLSVCLGVSVRLSVYHSIFLSVFLKRAVSLSLNFNSSPLPEACNFGNKPMQRHFYKPVYF